MRRFQKNGDAGSQSLRTSLLSPLRVAEPTDLLSSEATEQTEPGLAGTVCNAAWVSRTFPWNLHEAQNDHAMRKMLDVKSANAEHSKASTDS